MRFIGLLALSTLCSCGVAPEESAEPVAKKEDALTSLTSGTFWALTPGTPTFPTPVPVCFTTTGFDAEKQIAMDAIRQTWGRVLNVDFTFYTCTPGLQAVRVAVVGATTAEGGFETRVGKNGTYLASGVSTTWRFNVLGFGFPRDRIRYLAVTSFGHVLNFMKEDNHPQAGFCSAGGSSGISPLGAFDMQSLMLAGNGTCSNRYGNARGYLSPGDRANARTIYGTRPFRAPGDFAGQGLASSAVFRPGSGTWFIADGVTPPTSWGQAGDVPVGGDYNGDGKNDVAVYRPSASGGFPDGMWFIGDNETFPIQWGTPTDIPVPCDYNGDGKTDVAVYRPSSKTWIIRNQFNLVWGEPGDFLVPGDYNGDGRCEPAVFRPSTGQWFVAVGSGAYDFTLGGPGEIPVPGDYAGEGMMRPAVWKPSTGMWTFAVNPPSFPGGMLRLGQAGDIPVPGNYDGNGIDIPAVFHAEPGNTLFRKLNATQAWGQPGDIPVLGRRMTPVP